MPLSPRYGELSEKAGFGCGLDGFRGPRKGRSEPMVLSEKTLYSLGRRCVYIFNRRKAKKEIPNDALTGRRALPTKPFAVLACQRGAVV